MMNQLMDQVLSVQPPQTGTSQTAKTDQDQKDFDTLLRQKTQQDSPGKGTEKTAPSGKTEEETPKAGETLPAEIQAMAAMLLQRPVIVEAEPVAKTAEAVETAETEPAVEAAAVLPEAGTEVQPETAEVHPAEEALPQQVRQMIQPRQVQGQPQRPAEAPAEEKAPVQQIQPQKEQPQAEQKEVAPVRQEAPLKDAALPKETEEPKDSGKTEEEAPAAETPVFGRVEAVPVKVADSKAEAVDLSAPEAPERLAEKIVPAVEDGLSRVEITLTPENLGKLTVEISRSEDGTLSVAISAANPKAANVLEQHSSHLQNLLADTARSEVRVEVRNAQEAQQQFLNPDGQQQRRQEQRRQNHPDRNDQKADQDFVQQLRLGLVSRDEAVF